MMVSSIQYVVPCALSPVLPLSNYYLNSVKKKPIQIKIHAKAISLYTEIVYVYMHYANNFMQTILL